MSSRPVPQRTLPDPARLKVAQRDNDGFIASSSRSDVQALKSDLERRAEINRRADKWADRLMETTPSLGVFKKAYLEVTHERHLYNRCSYPPCENTSKRPFDPKKKIKISWTSRTISNCEGNPEDGFCGRGCRVKSDWVIDRLAELSVWDRASGGIKLLEDEEVDVQRDLLVPHGASASTKEGDRVQPPPVGKPISVSRPQESKPTRMPQIPKADKDLNVDLMGALSIVERPTPTSQPLPPSETPLSPPKAPSIPGTTRRDAGSLVKTPQELSAQLLNASRSMGPVPQLPPDSDDEGDDIYRIQEEEMGLTWGTEDDEVRRLFDEAQAARDMEGV